MHPSSSAAAAAAAAEAGSSASVAVSSLFFCSFFLKSIWPRCSVAATSRQWRTTCSSSASQPSIVARLSLASRHIASKPRASCAAAGLTYRHSRRPLSPSSSCSFALSAGGAQLAT